MKKKRLKKKKIWWKKKSVLLTGSLLGVLLLAVVAYLFLHKSPPKEVEARPEVKTLPKEVKKRLQALSPTQTIRIPVLMYHYVEYVKDKRDTIRQSLDTTPFTFEKQLQTLQNAHYTFLTTKDIADILDGAEQMPEKPVVLTFDDGYRDFYTDVYPLLKKYHIRATAYVCPGLLGGSNYMDPWQVQEIAANGLVEIAAHTLHHVYLKHTPLATVKKEVDDSKSQLEALIHQPVVDFAYPYGAFDDQAVNVVKQAGFRTAVSTIPGNETSQETRFFIFRIRTGGRTGNNLLSFLEQTTYKPY